jgi:methoxylated aromatic compound---corrinoid protein Co-methyltransferase
VNAEIERLFNQRLGRYQAAIALERTDRVPIATGSNYFAEIYFGNNNQETVYDSEKWLKGEEAFIKAFPEIDVLRNNRIWGPLYDAVGANTYRLPGRDLAPNAQFQFVEVERMRADEYDVLIDDPTAFIAERLLPRVLGELAEPGSPRAHIALVKGGMAQMMMGQIMRNRAIHLETAFGMPQPMTGVFIAPFDVLADVLRGLNGIFEDVFRRPDKVIAACDAIVHEIAHFALSVADPFKRYPIFVPTHKACFMSPDQFDEFYWPSFKKTMEILIESGYKIRAYLEGDWGHHWHHMLEMPKGSVLCDIDTQGDIFKAKEEIGHHQCLAGGVKDSTLILGTPEDVREEVKHLCETVGKGGGYIISGGCNFPYTTKPENFRAMIDAVKAYGTYDPTIKHRPKKTAVDATISQSLNPTNVITPWERKKAELGPIQGDEDLIRKPWETLEKMAHTWVWQWVM